MQDTDLSVAPYFDDFDETKDFHQILFRPEMVVQARELTQLQTILRKQIERFGDNIFNEGTIIKGCNFNYDENYSYVKLRDLRVDLNKTVVTDFIGLTVTDQTSGLTAVVVDAVDGYETQNPNTKTIYVKYMNTGSAQKKTFAADDTLTFLDSSGTVVSAYTTKVLPSTLDGNATNPIGTGYAFSVGDGVIYQKGAFIRVPAGLSVIVSKYTPTPSDIVVGFSTIETIVTENADTSLYDNSSGFTNEKAPGAHRLRMQPELYVYDKNSVPNSNFFVLAEWQNGVVVRENRDTQYSVLGQEFARRTSEESGDYVVNPFVVTTSSIVGNTTHLNLDTTQGIAYVNGYRVQKLNNLTTPIRKGTNTNQLSAQQLVANYGSYVIGKEAVGYIESNKAPSVSLRDTAGSQISNGTFNTSTASGTEIGTAKLISVNYNAGVPGTPNAEFRYYLTDIRMSAGKNFADVKSLFYTGGTADLVLESSKAVLKEAEYPTMVYPLGQGSIKTLRNGSNNNNQFTFRTVTTGSKILTTGVSGAITLTGGQQFPYGTGTLNETQERDVIVVATSAANVTLTKSGTITLANSNTAIVTGTSTAFVTEYQVGDFIYINTQARQITGIANNTSLTVTPNFTVAATTNAHAKHYPAGAVVPINNRNSVITLSNTTSMSISLFATNGAFETLSSNLNVAIYYDVTKTGAVEIQKLALKNQYIKIDCSNNAGNTVGPWSLGLPDVYDIVGVYKSTDYSEGAAYDVTSQFSLNNGQKDSFYDLASIQRIPGTTLSLTSADKLLVKVNTFRPNSGTGYGFFSIDSYPIDDANTANTTAVTTQTVPFFTSPKTGKIYALRDCVDMRPVVANTAVYSNNAVSATINPANTSSLNSTENYIASPNKTFSAGLEYYLGRIDKLVLDTYGNFRVVEGTPAVNPMAPNDVAGAMTISEITVTPYPSLSMKDAANASRLSMQVAVADRQVSRFTMRDLRKVVQRVENLEYYAALSLLDKQTSDLSVKDASGLERFKNGIFTDDFNDLSYVNVNDPEFSVVVDTRKSVVKPNARQQTVELTWSASVNTEKTGVALSLSYDDASLIDQSSASRTRNLGGVSWDYSAPTTTINPPYDPTYDEYTPPVATYGAVYDSKTGVFEYYDASIGTVYFTTADIQRVTQSGYGMIYDSDTLTNSLDLVAIGRKLTGV